MQSACEAGPSPRRRSTEKLPAIRRIAPKGILALSYAAGYRWPSAPPVPTARSSRGGWGLPCRRPPAGAKSRVNSPRQHGIWHRCPPDAGGRAQHTIECARFQRKRNGGAHYFKQGMGRVIRIKVPTQRDIVNSSWLLKSRDSKNAHQCLSTYSSCSDPWTTVSR